MPPCMIESLETRWAVASTTLPAQDFFLDLLFERVRLEPDFAAAFAFAPVVNTRSQPDANFFDVPVCTVYPVTMFSTPP